MWHKFPVFYLPSNNRKWTLTTDNHFILFPKTAVVSFKRLWEAMAVTLCFATGNKVVLWDMNSFHLHPCVLTQPWWDLLVEKFLASRKLSGWLSLLSSPLLSPHLSSPPSQLCRTWLTPERQQNVPALHLHVRAAFNKLNSILTGHWRWFLQAPAHRLPLAFTIPSYCRHLLLVMGLNFPHHGETAIKARDFTGETSCLAPTIQMTGEQK